MYIAIVMAMVVFSCNASHVSLSLRRQIESMSHYHTATPQRRLYNQLASNARSATSSALEGTWW